jgi:hypothetical protein
VAEEVTAASRFAAGVAPPGHPEIALSGTQNVVADALAGSVRAASAIAPASSRP